jgi:hypothetical protein
MSIYRTIFQYKKGSKIYKYVSEMLNSKYVYIGKFNAKNEYSVL